MQRGAGSVSHNTCIKGRDRGLQFTILPPLVLQSKKTFKTVMQTRWGQCFKEGQHQNTEQNTSCQLLQLIHWSILTTKSILLAVQIHGAGYLR